MLKLFTLFSLLLSFQLSAAVVVGKISKIDYPRTPNEQPLLLMSDGHVLKINGHEKSELNSYIEAQKDQQLLKVSVDKQQNVLSVETLGSSPEVSSNFLAEEDDDAEEDYLPSVLNTEEEALNIFRSLKRGARSKSQCYNRAHVWSYESKQKFNLNSMKVFVFYTRKYIREFNFNWWFHVSPFTYVNVNAQPQERVLDFKFANRPLTMKDWTDIFIYNHAVCPVIQKYSDYEDHQEEAYCYLHKASMFYYQPLDLDALERTGATKTRWIDWEVKNAYNQAFSGWWWQ